jgi:hypothetical protein
MVGFGEGTSFIGELLHEPLIEACGVGKANCTLAQGEVGNSEVSQSKIHHCKRISGNKITARTLFNLKIKSSNYQEILPVSFLASLTGNVLFICLKWSKWDKITLNKYFVPLT